MHLPRRSRFSKRNPTRSFLRGTIPKLCPTNPSPRTPYQHLFGILIAGLAEALIRSGDDLTLECGTVIEIILDRPIEV
jgi:hypothetical protein